MTDLSVLQALDVYSDLVTAYYNENHFGSNTAEIYAFRLKQNHPAANLQMYAKEENKQAAENLYNLILIFKKNFKCIVYIENKLFGTWLKKIDYFNHRLHIKVIRKDK